MKKPTNPQGPGDGRAAPSDDRQTLPQYTLPAGDRAEAERWLDQASRAAQAGDWATAEDAFLRGVSADPSDGRCHGGLALVAIREQDWARAVAHGQTAVSLPGAGVEVHNNLGWALEQLGREHEAIAAYERAFEADPTRSEPLQHLVRLGRVPGGDLEPLETLQRIDLYQAIAQTLGKTECQHTFAVAAQWAEARQAPWPAIAGWLLSQGVRCDCTVLRVLARQDRHLGTTVVSGLLLGDKRALAEIVRKVPALRLLAEGDAVPPNTEFDPQAPIALRFDPRVGRGEIPPQRAHAAMLVALFGELLPLLGPDGALLVTIDTVKHLEPRRLWILSGMADVEVQGAWALDGGNEDAERLFTPDEPMPLEAVPLEVPTVDAESLSGAVAREGLGSVIRVQDGLLQIDGRAVSAHASAFAALLGRLARWMPDGEERVVAWRDQGVDLAAALARGTPVVPRPLRSVWPPDQPDLDLPVPAELQVLGRALFEAPRAVRLLAEGG